MSDRFPSKRHLPLCMQLATQYDIDPATEGARIIGLEMHVDGVTLLGNSTVLFLKRVVQLAARCVYQAASHAAMLDVARESGLEFVRTVHVVLNGSIGMSSSTILRDMAQASNSEVEYQLHRITDPSTDAVKALALIVGLRVINEIADMGGTS